MKSNKVAQEGALKLFSTSADIFTQTQGSGRVG